MFWRKITLIKEQNGNIKKKKNLGYVFALLTDLCGEIPAVPRSAIARVSPWRVQESGFFPNRNHEAPAGCSTHNSHDKAVGHFINLPVADAVSILEIHIPTGAPRDIAGLWGPRMVELARGSMHFKSS